MGAILISENAETGSKIEVAYEILFLIANQLPKSDWKTLRLLSREFNKFATDLPFFEELWFSPHAEDLEVFQGVCAHPVWAKQVTTILYDTSLFSDFPLRLRVMELGWTNQLSWDDPNYETMMETHPGLNTYIQHAEAQTSVSTVEQLRLLTQGLRRLPNASRFQISSQFGGRWQSTGEVDYSKYRSPLARSWGSDWPEPPSWDPISPFIVHFIFSAIVDSKASIIEFTTSEKEDGAKLASICHPAQAFTFEAPLLEGVETFFGNITILKLRLRVQKGAGGKQFLPFSKLMRKAEKLKKLYLEFNEPEIDRVEYYQEFEWQQNNRLDLEILFGDTIFPHLQFLGLKGLYVTAASMEKLLNGHRKSLRGLTLEVRYLPCFEATGLARLFIWSPTSSVDDKTRFAGFLNELAKGLVDRMELASNIHPKCKAMNSRKHLGGGIYLVDMGDIGLAEDGWTLDTKDAI